MVIRKDDFPLWEVHIKKNNNNNFLENKTFHRFCNRFGGAKGAAPYKA